MRARRRAPTLALAVFAALFASAASAGAADDIEASSELTPRLVGVGERVQLTIAVQGPGFAMPARMSPRFDPGELVLVAGPDVNHGVRLTGGGGWRYSWTWWFEAKKPGVATVTDIHVLINDGSIDLPSRRVEVVTQAVGGADRPRTRLEAIEEMIERTRERLTGERPDAPPAAFLRAVASPARPFVGQRVVYTVYLYNRAPVTSCVADELPAFQGLWARPVDLPDARQERVEWEGEAYQRTAILRKELYALSARPRRIEPLRARLVVEEPEHERSMFFPTWTPRTVYAESNAIDLEVRPLPSDAPDGIRGGASFAGAVGGLAVATDLRPSEVSVGESATLTVTIVGEGHLESMPAPRVPSGDGLEVLGPQSVPADGLELPGQGGNGRRWQYVLVPRRPGEWELPPVEIPWFDPDEERYRVARASVPELTVLGDASADLGEAASEVAEAAPPRSWAGRWAESFRSAPAWVTVPLVAAPLLVVLLFVRRRTGVLERAGRKHALPRAPLEAALREERPRRAAAALESAWREWLADRYGVPDAVPPSRWADEALARGAERGACRELRELALDLHYLRFAPELSEARSLTAELVDRSERLALRFDTGRRP